MALIRAYKVNKMVDPDGTALFNFIRTGDKQKRIWQYLGRLRSQAYCTSLLQSLVPMASYNHDLIAKKAEHMSMTMTQAEEYFTSASQASMEIRPLLLYYGMLGLAKCLIMCGDNDYTLSSSDLSSEQHATHGLSWKAAAHDAAVRDSSDIHLEFCYVKNRSGGVYTLLRRCYAINDIPNNTRFIVQDLLSLIPDLQREFYRYYGVRPRTWRCEHRFTGATVFDSHHWLRFDQQDALMYRLWEAETFTAVLSRQFPILDSAYKKEGDRDDTYVSTNGSVSADDSIPVAMSLTGETHALMSLNGMMLTDMDATFLLMFILSNLVRYRQDKWTQLLMRQQNDQMFLIEAFVDVSATKFPNMILNELVGRNYVFIGEVARYG